MRELSSRPGVPGPLTRQREERAGSAPAATASPLQVVLEVAAFQHQVGVNSDPARESSRRTARG